MKGRHSVHVSTKHLRYDFELKRNITIIRGDSATGKTTLVDLVRVYSNDPSGSPVELVCDKNCFVVEGVLWKQQLTGIQDSIVFIDEGNEFVKSKEFASVVQQTDNYYVIVTRESLPTLPYSVEEIYGIRTSGKYATLKQSYHEFYRIYGDTKLKTNVKPEKIITEDSNSGYQFFKESCSDDILCQSANGKSNIFHLLKQQTNEKILVIADGAAFGPEVDRVIQLLKVKKNVILYLPESFEWLILLSDILKDNEVRKILSDPSEYIESQECFSWERYFTKLLVEKTQDTYLSYSKKTLNKAYLNDNIRNAIFKEIKGITFEDIRK